MAVQQASTQLPETPAELDGLIKARLNSELKVKTSPTVEYTVFSGQTRLRQRSHAQMTAPGHEVHAKSLVTFVRYTHRPTVLYILVPLHSFELCLSACDATFGTLQSVGHLICSTIHSCSTIVILEQDNN